MPSRRTVIAALTACLPLVGCKREDRPFRPGAASAEAVQWTRMSDLRPGPIPAEGVPGARVEPIGTQANPDGSSAYAVSEGKRLYSAFNCVGCHARGGGGIGPPLMDDTWRYGSDPEQVFSTIVEGRPNGMPTFGGRIPAYQIWWLVAYVRSMSGLGDPAAAPGRGDEMKAGHPEGSRDPETPRNVAPPDGSGATS